MAYRVEDGVPVVMDAEPRPEPSTNASSDDDLVDEESEESFPASDPPSTWAGPADPDPGTSHS